MLEHICVSSDFSQVGFTDPWLAVGWDGWGMVEMVEMVVRYVRLKFSGYVSVS